MTADLLDVPVRGPSLARKKLPSWSLPVIAVVVLALSYTFLRLGSLSWVQFALIAAVLYLIGQTLASTIVEGWRHAKDRMMTGLMTVALVLAVAPLIAVLGYTVAKGMTRMDSLFLTHSMRAVSEDEAAGGAYHAIIGTLEQVGIATVIAVPFGILVAVYLVEYSSGRLGRIVSFFVDVMTGLPSIVAGLFIYTLWILALGNGFSGFAGSLALVILMLPTVVRSAEEMLKLVPQSLREASYALGVAKWITVLRIVLPTALAGIVTGVMLAIARVMGETAPVLLTVSGSDSINNNPFSGPQDSLPLFVFNEAQLPNQTAIDRAWAGALTLIAIVLILNLIARAIARFARVRG
ncbi:MAG TPA: phosphate ABC transporter permease PstA [Pseudonocardiaceae bacterium]|jgi:phosphate transport system permease protein|nr:phosphate ABC transporter permease PstA [Pseudonocardiaceae bacterium]